GELLAAPWTPLQSSRKTKPAETRMIEAMNGRLLSIRSRIATVTHVDTTSVAQVEFTASQMRPAVTKLGENGGDEPLEVRPFTEAGVKPLMYRFTLVATFIIFLLLL